MLSAVLRAKLIEVVVRQERTVALLPRADMDARDGKSIARLGGAKLHEPSIACGREPGPGVKDNCEAYTL